MNSSALTSVKPDQATIDALYRESFAAFVRKAFYQLNPSTPFLENWHIDAILFEIDQVLSGKVLKLGINIPPRCLKSFMVSVCLPAYLLGKHPEKTVFVVSHNKALATDLAAQFRKIVSADWYLSAFAHMREADKDTELNFRTTQSGGRIALSTEMGVTGLGADFIIIDDPIDASEARNQAICFDKNDWLSKVLMTRMNNPSKTPMILVMQRIGEYDSTAHFSQFEDWRWLKLPAIAQKDMTIHVGADKTFRFKQGDLLHPDRLSPSFLKQQQTGMGDADFSAQYLQSPIP